MSETPPPPPPAGGPPPPPPEGYGTGQYGQPNQYGQPAPGQYGQQPGAYGQPQQPGAYGAPQAVGTPRPGELLDRFLARLIDGILFGVVYFIIGIIFAAILVSDPSVNFATGEVDSGSRVLYNIVFGVVSTLISLGYFALMESSRGQTVGKMIMKLRVYGPDHKSNPTLQQAVIRNIWLALGLLAILGTIGTVLNLLASIAALVIIVMGINTLPNRQTKFDELAGGTQVMKIG